MQRAWLVLIVCMIGPLVEKPIRAQATPPDGCPMIIRIDADGKIFENRMLGMYRVSPKTLEQDLKGGCKERGPVSSVTVHADPATKHTTRQSLLDLIRSNAPAGIPIKISGDHAAS
jgi:biopolymer transport protein ExbD